FFLSRRRRHTRSKRDWSSDVCSSDLNRLLKRVRDFAQVRFDGHITKEVADYALDLLDVDKEGLDQTDRDLLLAMIEKFGGGPVRSEERRVGKGWRWRGWGWACMER